MCVIVIRVIDTLHHSNNQYVMICDKLSLPKKSGIAKEAVSVSALYTDIHA